MKTFIIIAVLCLAFIALRPSAHASHRDVISANHQCVLFVSDWTTGCNNPAASKLTQSQQTHKLNRCAIKATDLIMDLPDGDPAAAEQAEYSMEGCLMGPNTSGDLASR